MKVVHWIQVALGCVTAGAIAAVRFVPPQYAWVPELVAAVGTAAQVPLGLASPSVGVVPGPMIPPKGEAS